MRECLPLLLIVAAARRTAGVSGFPGICVVRLGGEAFTLARRAVLLE